MSQFLVPVGRRFLTAWLVVGIAMLQWVVVLHAGGELSCTVTEVATDPPPYSASAAPGGPSPMAADAAGRSPAPWDCDDPVSSGAPDASATLEVGAWDMYFDPTEIHLPVAEATRIVLTNHGYAAHNVTIDELGLELVVGRGMSDEVTLDGVPPGTYAFYCSVSGHRLAGMEGTLIVE